MATSDENMVVTGPREVGWDRGNGGPSNHAAAEVATGPKLVPNPHPQQVPVEKTENEILSGPIQQSQGFQP